MVTLCPLVTMGCGEVTFDIDERLAELISTVEIVNFDVDVEEVDSAFVDYGTPGQELARWPADRGEDGSFSATLLGLKPSHEVEFRVGVIAAGEELLSEPWTVETGAPPDGPFDPEIGGTAAGDVMDLFVVTCDPVSPSLVLVYDRDGDLVWWFEDSDSQLGMTRGMTRARLSVDRRSILYASYAEPPANAQTDEFGALRRVSIDGSEQTRIEIPGAHHDFVQADDGTVAALAYDARDTQGQWVVGDQILVTRPDGAPELLWSSWETEIFDPADVDFRGAWTHANALVRDLERNLYYVSLRNLSAILAIDGDTGEVVWRFGGPHSDFQVAMGGEPFAYQHQFIVDGNRIVVYDNGLTEGMTSRVVEYELDHAQGIATQTWSYQLDPPIYTPILGDVVRLPDEHLLIAWSASGQLDELSAEDEVLWQLNMNLGGALAYVSVETNLAPP